MSLETITLAAKYKPPKGLVVLLHGWGANHEDLVPIAQLLRLSEVEFQLPNAPIPHPYNPVGRMWYNLPEDYSFMSSPDFYHQPDLAASRQQLTMWLTSLPEITGVGLDRTILAGFSQGGAMTLDVGLSLPLAGLLIMSGYLHAVNPQAQPIPKPTFIVHGRQDAVVPIQAAYQTQAYLTSVGFTPEYQELAMGHEINPTTMALMQDFIDSQLV